MIKHFVLFGVVGSTPQEKMQEACNRLEALVGVVPRLVSLKAGIDIGVEGNFDFGLVAEFNDRDGLNTFSTDPDHLKVAEFIAEFRSDIAILDLAL
jgi:hypothetical protein